MDCTERANTSRTRSGPIWVQEVGGSNPPSPTIFSWCDRTAGRQPKRMYGGVDPTLILDVLVAHGCRFVVVGPTARPLRGAVVVPADLDIVIADGHENRRRLKSPPSSVNVSRPASR